MIKLTQQPYTTKDRNTLINIDTARVTLASEYSSPSWCFELFLPWTPKPEQTGAIISPNVIVVRLDQGPTPLYIIHLGQYTSSVLMLAPWCAPNSYISVVLAHTRARAS